MDWRLNSLVFEKSILIPNTIPGVKFERKLTPLEAGNARD